MNIKSSVFYDKLPNVQNESDEIEAFESKIEEVKVDVEEKTVCLSPPLYHVSDFFSESSSDEDQDLMMLEPSFDQEPKYKSSLQPQKIKEKSVKIKDKKEKYYKTSGGWRINNLGESSDDENDKMGDYEFVPVSSYHEIEQTSWENNIIWETDENQSSGTEFENLHKISIAKLQRMQLWPPKTVQLNPFNEVEIKLPKKRKRVPSHEDLSSDDEFADNPLHSSSMSGMDLKSSSNSLMLNSSMANASTNDRKLNNSLRHSGNHFYTEEDDEEEEEEEVRLNNLFKNNQFKAIGEKSQKERKYKQSKLEKQVTSYKMPYKNEDFDDGNWINQIQWDDFIAERKNLPFVFDLNDKNMLFEDDFLENINKLMNKSKTEEKEKENKKQQEKEKKNNPLNEEIDKFNQSNDEYYINTRISTKRKKVTKEKIYHAPVALKLTLVKPHLSSEELEHFHQPRTFIIPDKFPRKFSGSWRKSNIKMNERSGTEAFKKKEDLSSKDGDLIIVEYIEKHPLMVMNIGMASKLINYTRNKSYPPPPSAPQPSANKEASNPPHSNSILASNSSAPSSSSLNNPPSIIGSLNPLINPLNSLNPMGSINPMNMMNNITSMNNMMNSLHTPALNPLNPLSFPSTNPSNSLFNTNPTTPNPLLNPLNTNFKFTTPFSTNPLNPSGAASGLTSNSILHTTTSSNSILHPGNTNSRVLNNKNTINNNFNEGFMSENAYEEGETIVLKQTEESPFLGDVIPGKTVRSLENNMFRVPISKHKSDSNDFLVIVSKDHKKLFIRDLPPTFCAGQIQPILEVPAPNSRNANLIMKNRLQSFITRFFKRKSKKKRTQRLRIADICSAFPWHSEPNIRKHLKQIADFQRGGDDSGWWTVRSDIQLPTEDQLQSITDPEKVCLFESMRAGLKRLQNLKIDRLTNPSGIQSILQNYDAATNSINTATMNTGGSTSNLLSNALNANTQITINPKLLKQLQILEEQLILTPWNLTSNFISSMSGQGLLQLSNFGAPTKLRNTFSYIKLPQKLQQQQQKQKIQQQQIILPKNTVTGTDADLRKLSLEDAKTVLLKFGVAESVIDGLTRWGRIKLVRKKSSEAAAIGKDPQLTKFARGTRFSTHQQQVQYKEHAQMIFNSQLQFISSAGSHLQDEEDDEDEEDEEDDEEDADDSDPDDFTKNLNYVLDQNPSSTPTAAGGAGTSTFQQIIGKKRKREAENSPFLSNKVQATSPSFGSSPFMSSSQGGLDGSRSSLLKSSSSLGTSMQSPFISEHSSQNRAEPPPPPRPKGPFPPGTKWIKKITTIKNNDGTTTKRIEIVHDPEKIHELSKIIKQQARPKHGTIKPQLSAEEEMQKNQLRRERRRLQERNRRLEKNKEKQRINRERLINGITDDQKESSAIQITCGACGLVGHMRTNRNCPIFQEREQANAAEMPKNPLVELDGTKLRFSKKLLEEEEEKDKSNEKLTIKISKQVIDEMEKKNNQTENPAATARPRKVKRGRRSKGQLQIALNNVLEKIVGNVKTQAFSVAFRNRVQKKEAPDYYDVVKNPMYLNLIYNNCKDGKYSSVEAMMDDINLLVDNCYEYNKNRNVHLLPIADQIKKTFEELIAAVFFSLFLFFLSFLNNIFNYAAS